MSSLSSHGSVINSYSPDQSSSITDLDETVKSPPLKPLRISSNLAECYDGGVFDDGNGSQTEEDENHSGIVAESDEEDEIEHFDSTEFMMANLDDTQAQLNDADAGETKYEQADSTQSSMEAQTANIGMARFRLISGNIIDVHRLDLDDGEDRDTLRSNNNVSEA